jgi:TolA-binding protein
MSKIPSNSEAERALTSLVEMARDATKPATEVELERGLNSLRRRLSGENLPRWSRRRWSLAALAALAVVSGLVLGTVAVSEHRERSTFVAPPISVDKIEGGKLLGGGYLSESGHSGIKLLFSEGSLFALEPGTRGRLRTVTNHGAHFAIDRGTAAFRITHRPEHRWLVEAGPFLVTVTGTEFTVSWEPASEEFELRLHRGRVTVSGPVLGEELVLKPGQTLRVNLPRAETVITDEPLAQLEREQPAASTSALALAPGSPPTIGSETESTRKAATPPAASTVSGAPTERRWREALANGQWDRILAEVEQAGVDATLQSASSSDLFALADAARYRRRTDLARASLLAQRRRFPGSPRSLDAVFLLGRVEESGANGKAQAIRWYDEYVSRAPTGTYAAEALGRKMVLSNELQGAASARPVAAEYLRRFPKGSYAAAARALQLVP